MQPCHVPLGVSLRDLKKDLNLHQTNNGEVFEVAHFKENDQHGKKKQKKKKKNCTITNQTTATIYDTRNTFIHFHGSIENHTRFETKMGKV